MNFENFITGSTGLIHFIASLMALLTGTFVLLMPKGTTKHKRIGQIYVMSMLVVLSTAFMTYKHFGNWGIFHWTAGISSITLILGFIPIYLRRPLNSYISLHFCFMYWSVMGVYAAFVSETLVRMPKVVVDSNIPNKVFYQMTGIGTALIMALGLSFFLKYKPKWNKQFAGSTLKK